MDTKKTTILKKQTVPTYNPKKYQTKRLFAKAKDGTKIPISLAYKKGVKKQPLYLMGYGAYEYAWDPYFSKTAAVLLKNGFSVAIAHIRGGGEGGRPWYESGKFLKKKNTFTDFIACAEHLCKTGYTTKKQLVIEGGSAGGLLVGAVLNMKPDCCQAAVASVPFVDVINTMLDASIPLTVPEYEEWGNPNKKKFFDYMLSYSPYDNIKQQPYPHLYVTAGLNDTRVHFWEPAKWVAKLRAMKTDNNILVLKTNMGAGHCGKTARDDYLKDWAEKYAFAMYAIKN